MMGKMCGIHKVAGLLLFIGGANWLLVGLFKMDLFEMLGLGMESMVARAVYVLVGVSAVMMLGCAKCCAKCEKCGTSVAAPMGGQKM